MKKFIFILFIAMTSISMTTTAQANWFGSGNNGEWKMGPNGPYWDESDWPEWTPMYWMEEFMDSWDDNDNNWNYGGYYGAPYGGYNMNPYGNMPYGYMPPAGGYAYPAPAPQVPAVPSVPVQ